jgi:hypothetical protein
MATSSGDINDNLFDTSSNNLKTEGQSPKLSPMTPLAASATVINLILATGPFT